MLKIGLQIVLFQAHFRLHTREVGGTFRESHQICLVTFLPQFM